MEIRKKKEPKKIQSFNYDIIVVDYITNTSFLIRYFGCCLKKKPQRYARFCLCICTSRRINKKKKRDDKVDNKDDTIKKRDWIP